MRRGTPQKDPRPPHHNHFLNNTTPPPARRTPPNPPPRPGRCPTPPPQGAHYEGTRPVLICVLKGAVFFMADLARRLPFELEFMAISSYGASTDSSGVVRILKDLDINIEGRHVLVVEDIIDSGLTLAVPDQEPEVPQSGQSWR